MISAAADDFDARVAAFERYIDELDRRTYSNFSVTNPTTGVKHLQIGPTPAGYELRLRDDHGNIIYGNDTTADWGVTGYWMPLPMYPAVPASGLLFGTSATWVTTWETTTFVSTAHIQIRYIYQDVGSSGGTSEFRVAYDAGAGLVVMPESLVSAVNPGVTGKQFSYSWLSDFYDTEVKLSFQCRMASGSGAAVISPVFLVGG